MRHPGPEDSPVVVPKDVVAGRRRAAHLTAVVVVGLLASCTSRARTSPSPGGKPPPGWVRHEYGSLSVAVPASWRGISTPPANCFPPPNNTLTEVTVSAVQYSPCPAMTGNGPKVRAVVIECLVGRADGWYRGAPRTAVVAGRRLGVADSQVYLQDADAEGVVYLADPFGPTALGQRILASVIPT